MLGLYRSNNCHIHGINTKTNNPVSKVSPQILLIFNLSLNSINGKPYKFTEIKKHKKCKNIHSKILIFKNIF